MKRSQYKVLTARLKEDRRFIQVLVGPRQVGKTTLVQQVIEDIDMPCSVYSADAVPGAVSSWIPDIWESERLKMISAKETERILVIDEIQKLDNWSEYIKKEWDRDTFEKRNLKVVLLGSSQLMIQKGLTESLAGRFEVIRMGQWSLKEMRDAFGFDVDTYIYFGGYPGAASLVSDEVRWRSYMRDALIESAISKDVLMTTPIYKPALLRQLFELACFYSGELISLNKLLGQLQDAGNVTTLSNYLHVLDQCNLLVGLQKYAVDNARKYNSVPKMQVYNNALKNSYGTLSFSNVHSDATMWGRQVESAVGAHIINQAESTKTKVYYWREKNDEVDFVLENFGKTVAIEVKSGRRKINKGLPLFRERYHPYRAFVVGIEGVSVEDFLNLDLNVLFE